jgi:hypothetical protein
MRLRGRGLIPFSLLWWPATAHAAEAEADVAWIIAGLLAAVAVAALVALVHIYRRYISARSAGESAEARLARLGAAFAAGGAAAYYWAQDGTESASPNLAEFLGQPGSEPAGYANILGSLENDAAAALETAVARLRGAGKGFALRLMDRQGQRVFRAAGLRADADGDAVDMIWLDDVTEQAARIPRPSPPKDGRLPPA